MEKFRDAGGFILLEERYQHRLSLYQVHADHFSNVKNTEVTPDKVFEDEYKHFNFYKGHTADPFPPVFPYSRYFHYDGFTRLLSS